MKTMDIPQFKQAQTRVAAQVHVNFTAEVTWSCKTKITYLMVEDSA